MSSTSSILNVFAIAARSIQDTVLDFIDHFWGFGAFSKKQNLKRKSSDNLGQNCELFHVLAQFLFITSETELDH